MTLLDWASVDRIEHIEQRLLRHGPAGNVLLVLLALSLVGAIATAGVSLPRRTAEVSRRLLFGATIAVHGLALVACFWVTHSARGELVAALAGVSRDGVKLEALERASAAISLTAVCTLLVSALLGLGVLRLSFRWVTRVLVLSIACTVCVTAWAALWYEQSFGVRMFGGCGDPAIMWEMFWENLSEARAALWRLVHVLPLVACAAGAASVALAVRESRRGWIASRRALLAALAVLALGVVLFARTRAYASDVQSGLPHRNYHSQCPVLNSSVPSPIGTSCEPLWEKPLVEIGATSVWVDGVPLEGSGAVIRALEDKRALWQQINPRRTLPVKRLLVAASGALPMRAVRPVLESLEQAGYSRLFLLVRDPPATIMTATLGAVPKLPRCCAAGIKLGKSGEPLSHFGSWEDVARVAQERAPTGADLTLRVAPATQ